jgi:hypothetical protein
VAERTTEPEREATRVTDRPEEETPATARAAVIPVTVRGEEILSMAVAEETRATAAFLRVSRRCSTTSM